MIVLNILAAVAFGAKESTIVNNVFTLVNLTVVVFVVISGSIKGKDQPKHSHCKYYRIKISIDHYVIFFPAQPKNWALENPPAQCGEKLNESCGDGGFAPYGIPGIIKGAASCFYGFIGFDTIATAGKI